MKTLVAGFAIVALSAPIVAALEESEHISRTVSFAPGGVLHVTTFSGHVTITGSDDHQVVVDAVRHGPRDRLDRIKLEIRTSGQSVFIETNHRESSWFNRLRSDVVDTDLDVRVPRRTDVHVTTFSAPVTVEAVDGMHDVHGFSSRIRLANVSGPVDAKTFSGPVEIRIRDWQDRESIVVNTFSGPIELALPPDAHGHLTFNSFSGRLNSDLPLTLHESSTRRVSAELGSGNGGPSLQFHTFSGNVKILQ